MEESRRAFLLLGEGDFTFTRALRQHLPGDVTLVTTSFDARSEVTEKYRDVESLLLKWDEEENIYVFHGIDATLDLRKQLRERSGEVAEYVFETVCFNFPHLGVENARLHGLMVAHVMQQAANLFAYNEASLGVPSKECRFVLALADAQALRWHTREMGQRNNLHQICTYPFRAADWPGYEVRRHINGKSFKTRVDSCSFFIHRPGGGGSSEDDSPFVTLLRRLRETVPSISDAKGSDAEAPLLQQQKKKKKKRKVATLTDGHWTSRAPSSEECSSGGVDPSVLVYECSLCASSKTFKSEASVVGHVYNVHFMGSSPSSSTSPQGGHRDEDTDSPAIASDNAHQCNICGKQAKGAQALRMHIMAAHGDYQVLKPHWAAQSQSLPASTTTAAAAAAATATAAARKSDIAAMGEIASPSLPNPLFAELTSTELSGYRVECDACGTFFQSEEALLEHQVKGFQPQESPNEAHRCSRCSRLFKDQRALYQHMNLCRAL